MLVLILNLLLRILKIKIGFLVFWIGHSNRSVLFIYLFIKPKVFSPFQKVCVNVIWIPHARLVNSIIFYFKNACPREFQSKKLFFCFMVGYIGFFFSCVFSGRYALCFLQCHCFSIKFLLLNFFNSSSHQELFLHQKNSKKNTVCQKWTSFIIERSVTPFQAIFRTSMWNRKQLAYVI